MKKEACVSLMESLDILRYERWTLANQYKKKRKAKHFHETSSSYKAMCFMCKSGGGMSHNKGLTMNKDGGVWEQEIESTCGKRRIYTAFLEGKLVTRFKASAL